MHTPAATRLCRYEGDGSQGKNVTAATNGVPTASLARAPDSPMPGEGMESPGLTANSSLFTMPKQIGKWSLFAIQGKWPHTWESAFSR